MKKQMERFERFRGLMIWVQRRNQMKHFRKRLEERAGVNNPAPLANEVLDLVERGRLALVPKKHFSNYECYEVRIQCLDGLVVYDPETGALVTYLPEAQQLA